MKTNLLNFDLNALTEHFAQMGEKPFRAKQVMRWIHQGGAESFDEMTDLAKSLRAKLQEKAIVGNGCWMSARATAWKPCSFPRPNAARCAFHPKWAVRWNARSVLPGGRASTAISPLPKLSASFGGQTRHWA